MAFLKVNFISNCRPACILLRIGIQTVLSCLVAGSMLANTSLAQQSIPPEKILGRQTCAACHQAELKAWEKSSHNLKSWQLLDHPKAAEFAKAIGVTDVKAAGTCTSCHGTQQQMPGKTIQVAAGNSCESCHGGAGNSKDGWLLKHFDFGQGRKLEPHPKMSDLLLDRGKEAADHRAGRDTTCKQLGMNRSSDPYQLAKNCLQCHLVPNEKLVEAGHPMSTRFEFVEWAQGEVRHNFLLDTKTNAQVPTNWSDPKRHGGTRSAEGRKRLMFVVGQIADLEVNLRIRAIATSFKRGTLGDEANDRILDIQEELEELEIPELKPILDAVKAMDKKMLKDADSDRAIFTDAADKISAAAEAFVKAHADGSKLPQSIKIPSKAKGEAFDNQ